MHLWGQMLGRPNEFRVREFWGVFADARAYLSWILARWRGRFAVTPLTREFGIGYPENIKIVF